MLQGEIPERPEGSGVRALRLARQCQRDGVRWRTSEGEGYERQSWREPGLLPSVLGFCVNDRRQLLQFFRFLIQDTK